MKKQAIKLAVKVLKETRGDFEKAFRAIQINFPSIKTEQELGEVLDEALIKFRNI